MAIGADAIRGYVDLMVLSLLRTEPSYAYELTQRITSISDSNYAVKQTTLYSAVKRLENSGLVTSYAGISPTGMPRTYYRITEAGFAHFGLKVKEWQATKLVVDKFINEAPEGGTP